MNCEQITHHYPVELSFSLQRLRHLCLSMIKRFQNPEGEINGAGDAPGPSSDLMDEDDEEEDIDGILGADDAADDTEEGLSQDKIQKLESIRQKSQ